MRACARVRVQERVYVLGVCMCVCEWVGVRMCMCDCVHGCVYVCECVYVRMCVPVCMCVPRRKALRGVQLDVQDVKMMSWRLV